MKRVIFISGVLFLGFILTLSFAAEVQAVKTKIILLITEQNIQGPQHAWWASEIDLSSSETAVAKKFIESGFEVLEPESFTRIIRQDRAFRMVNLSQIQSIKLGKLSKADYVVLGKAIASAGSKVPQSNMFSCFANITAKVIRVKDGKVIAYLDAAGNSAHMDTITGGKEALTNAGEDLAIKAVEALSKEGGR